MTIEILKFLQPILFKKLILQEFISDNGHLLMCVVLVLSLLPHSANLSSANHFLVMIHSLLRIDLKGYVATLIIQINR